MNHRHLCHASAAQSIGISHGHSGVGASIGQMCKAKSSAFRTRGRQLGRADNISTCCFTHRVSRRQTVLLVWVPAVEHCLSTRMHWRNTHQGEGPVDFSCIADQA